jgi:hypothetical protein
MSKWPKGWRPETAGEAKAYLDAHENGAGDVFVIEECERLLALAEHQTRPSRDAPPVDQNRTVQ